MYIPDRIIDVLNNNAGKDGISLPEQVGDDGEPEGSSQKPQEELVTPSVPESPALRRGEIEAEKEGDTKKVDLITPVPQVGDKTINVVDYGQGKRERNVPPNRYSGVISNEGVVLTQLTMKKGLAKHGKLAEQAVCKEFVQLFKEKKALKSVRREDIDMKTVKEKIRSSMF